MKGELAMTKNTAIRGISKCVTRAQLMALLCGAQRTCAPINVSMGSVNDAGQVVNKGLTIHKAPPIILQMVQAAVEYYLIRITPNGIYVDLP